MFETKLYFHLLFRIHGSVKVAYYMSTAIYVEDIMKQITSDKWYKALEEATSDTAHVIVRED